MLNQVKEKLSDWEIIDESKIRKTFNFKGFLKTMSFVNAVAWEANKQMHHPDMEVSFSKCVINLTTHDEGNSITQKDIDMAVAIEALF